MGTVSLTGFYGSFVCGLQILGDLHNLQMVSIFLAVQRSNKGKYSAHTKGRGPLYVPKVSRGPVCFFIFPNSIVITQPDFHLTLLDHFFKHDEQCETPEKMDYFLSSYSQPNSRAREVLFSIQTGFLFS